MLVLVPVLVIESHPSPKAPERRLEHEHEYGRGGDRCLVIFVTTSFFGGGTMGAMSDQNLSLAAMLQKLVQLDGSDLHLTPNSPPRIRIHGKLSNLDYPVLTDAATKKLAYSVMTDRQKFRYEENLEVDFSFGIKNLARFRGNVFTQRGAVSAVFRAIPLSIKSFEELRLPPIVQKLCDKPRGLVLITGPTGSGKTTTLAAMIDKINRERREHIITIEDPIEFIHQHKGCIVNQREIHSDTSSFASALKMALREDPDVVLVGEMRDLETIESALRISETGHLTLATLHTNSASATINRVIDAFPPHQQAQIRTQLSMVLEGIVCQTLVPRADGSGRVAACEIMIPNSAIRNLIRENKVHQLYSSMQTGQDRHGMQTMNQALATLYATRQISFEDCMNRSSNPDELEEILKRMGAGQRLTAGSAG